MRELFKKLEGLNYEEGLKIIKTAIPQIKKEINEIDKTSCDIDLKFNENDYFHYTTSIEDVENGEPNIDLENGYWGLMFEGHHLTHAK